MTLSMQKWQINSTFDIKGWTLLHDRNNYCYLYCAYGRLVIKWEKCDVCVFCAFYLLK